MSHVGYRFHQGGHAQGLLYTRVRDALAKAIYDLHNHAAAPEAITYGGRVVLDAAAIGRVYAACRAELEADAWHTPPSLDAAGRRELERPAANLAKTSLTHTCRIDDQ